MIFIPEKVYCHPYKPAFSAYIIRDEAKKLLIREKNTLV